MRRRHFLAAAPLLATACQQEDGPYPSREIRLIVQASPGGLSDSVSRFMASLAEPTLGVPVVCENKPGASGARAFSYVARRPADGYTIGHGPVELTTVRSLGFADVGADVLDLLCLVSLTPPVLVVQQDAIWGSFEEFLDAARERSGHLIMANSGTGSIWHFNTLLLEQGAGIRVTHLPYSGSSGSLASLLGGHVDAVVAGAGEAIANVQAGRLRALAIFDTERSSIYPDTPTTYELGYDIGAPAWSGFYGPQGMPEPVRSKLEIAFAQAAETTEWAQLCGDRGMEPRYLPAAEFGEFAAEQTEFFSREIPKLLRLER